VVTEGISSGNAIITKNETNKVNFTRSEILHKFNNILFQYIFFSIKELSAVHGLKEEPILTRYLKCYFSFEFLYIIYVSSVR
jgi:hypothetical protein